MRSRKSPLRIGGTIPKSTHFYAVGRIKESTCIHRQYPQKSKQNNGEK
jgi:hypothetical protein